MSENLESNSLRGNIFRLLASKLRNDATKEFIAHSPVGSLNTERPFSRIRHGSEIVFWYSILGFWSNQEWSESELATAQILSEIRMGQNPTLLLPAEQEEQSLKLYYLDWPCYFSSPSYTM